MKDLSRRDFLNVCIAAGAGGLAAICAGCGRRAGLNLPPLEPGERPAPGVAADDGFEPAYLELHRSGELKRRGERLWDRMMACRLCPRSCMVNRIEGERGFCQATSELLISSYHPHFGEERPLVGDGGSGTVFFTHCSLRCVFCINYPISLEGQGDTRQIEQLARMMLSLQDQGCANINMVTPTHYSAHILLALDKAASAGLRLPLVYNTCGWELMDVLELLDGVVDIYLPDFKYSSGEMAAKYSTMTPADFEERQPEVAARFTRTDNYPEVTAESFREMNRQVGVAKPGPDGLVMRGLMARHLVMPGEEGVQNAIGVVEWIAENLPKDTYLNIMSQYTPMYKAFDHPEIARRVRPDEYERVVAFARDAGLTNLDIQGPPLL
ncbi:MAG: radical SAM protein [Armatimonadota bacterium]|jgi:putative pyruvate formate lyase activating enzyme